MMVCIYLGFAKKQTYQAYSEICELYCLRCCCNCCGRLDLELYYHSDVLKRQDLKQKLIAESTFPTGTFGNTTNVTTRPIGPSTTVGLTPEETDITSIQVRA